MTQATLPRAEFRTRQSPEPLAISLAACRFCRQSDLDERFSRTLAEVDRSALEIRTCRAGEGDGDPLPGGRLSETLSSRGTACRANRAQLMSGIVGTAAPITAELYRVNRAWRPGGSLPWQGGAPGKQRPPSRDCRRVRYITTRDQPASPRPHHRPQGGRCP